MAKTKIWSTDKCDTEFSIFIRKRDVFCYFGCGRKSTQNSHFWGRGHSATRYDPLNCDGACGRCHMDHGDSKQGLYRDLKMKQLGLAGYNALMRKANSTYPREKARLECMLFLQGVK